MVIKKGQMKIQQMAFMLIAVTLFFVLVGMFVLVIQFSNLKESAAVLEEKNALLLVIKLANSPEFSCGNSYGRGKLNCVDFDKVMVLKENSDKYRDFWGVENIQLRKIYPHDNTICTMDNYPECGIIQVRDGQINSTHENFVTLCRKENIDGKVEDKCELGRIMVSYDA
jgi:hypothetical protein